MLIAHTPATVEDLGLIRQRPGRASFALGAAVRFCRLPIHVYLSIKRLPDGPSW